MKMLTRAEKEKYIESDYGKCPYCGSENITGHTVEVGGNAASLEVTCECGRRWYDLYQLTEVIEESPESPITRGDINRRHNSVSEERTKDVIDPI